MLFSVLVPVYNVEKYLRGSIDSILSQDCDDYEVILVDDGSTDSSPAVCDEYRNRCPNQIRVIHKKNEGLLLARRDAIAAAKGEYLVFADSDDQLAEHALIRYKRCIEESHPDFILTDVYAWMPDGRLKQWGNFDELPHAPAAGVLSEEMELMKKCLLTQKYCCWSMCQKCVRNVSARTDYDFRRLRGLQYGEDTLQTLFIFNQSVNYVYLDGCFYKYRMGSGMMSNRGMKNITDYYTVSEVMREQCRNWIEDYNNYIDLFLANYTIEYLMNLAAGDAGHSEMRWAFQNILEYKNLRAYLAHADAVKDNYDNLNDARKKCNHMLVNEQYERLYCALKIRKALKRKTRKQRESSRVKNS